MHLKPGFTFVPLLSAEAAAATPAPVDPQPPYGYLSELAGHWVGTGFNMITRHFFDPSSDQTHFLELNLTNETIDFAIIEGAIPNRGRLQGDIDMYGLTYLQQISDANLSTKDKIVGLPHVGTFTLVNAQGKVFNFSRSWPIPPIDVIDRDFFNALRQRGGPTTYLSKPIQNRATGTWVVQLARKIPSPNGEFIGLVTAAIELESIEQFFATHAL